VTRHSVHNLHARIVQGVAMFPDEFVRPMREELTRVGFQELRTPQAVDAALQQEKRTVLVVVNSVCGCAAGKARPAVALALSNQARPEVLATVFAGQDLAAISPATPRRPLPSPCCAMASWSS
jgi:putative YphP/YqiW family bacilliredoxin